MRCKCGQWIHPCYESAGRCEDCYAAAGQTLIFLRSGNLRFERVDGTRHGGSCTLIGSALFGRPNPNVRSFFDE